MGMEQQAVVAEAPVLQVSDMQGKPKDRSPDMRRLRVLTFPWMCAQVVERMTGAAPRVAQQKVVGEAQVLQVFEMAGRRADARTAVAGCRISEGSIRTGSTFKVLRGGDLVSTEVPAVPLDPGRDSSTSLGLSLQAVLACICVMYLLRP